MAGGRERETAHAVWRARRAPVPEAFCSCLPAGTRRDDGLAHDRRHAVALVIETEGVVGRGRRNPELRLLRGTLLPLPRERSAGGPQAQAGSPARVAHRDGYEGAAAALQQL